MVVLCDMEPRYLDARSDTPAVDGPTTTRAASSGSCSPHRAASAHVVAHLVHDHGMDLSPTGPFAPWVHSVSGGFTVDILDVTPQRRRAPPLDDGRTFARPTTRRRPEIGDGLVGRRCPSSQHRTSRPHGLRCPPARCPRHGSRATAAHGTGSSARRATRNAGDASPSDEQGSMPLSAYPGWAPRRVALDHIGLPDLLSETDTFLADMDNDLAAAYLLDERQALTVRWLSGHAWLDDRQIDSTVERNAAASFVTAALCNRLH